MDKKVNLNVSDVTADFFAHEASVNFNPTQFILDFKCITPRVDPRAKNGPIINLRHNIIMVDAYHAKRLHELLGNVIEKYENEFGVIKKPRPLEIMEKNIEKFTPQEIEDFFNSKND